MPLGLHARGEYEYVGHKLLDVGNLQHPDQYKAIPVGETRLALIRTFMNGRLQLGANGMIARGYTGQTTETFAPGWEPGAPPPACAPGVDGIANNFNCVLKVSEALASAWFRGLAAQCRGVLVANSETNRPGARC